MLLYALKEYGEETLNLNETLKFLCVPSVKTEQILSNLLHSHPSGTSNGISSCMHFTVPSWNCS